MIINCDHCGEDFETDTKTDLCGRCEQFLHDLQWQENNIDQLYEYGEDGFCDGFTRN